MIRSFRHNGLQELFEEHRTRKIDKALHKRIIRRLDALDRAKQAADVRIPGFNFHRLQGDPVRYSIHVNGPWCITFEFDEENATKVDLENYHR